MKLIILRDPPLKLDFYESLSGLRGPSIVYKKAAGNVLLKREGGTAPSQRLSLMREAHINRMLGC